ncbi:hypothetical protein ACLK19_12615 [Escherichia coli]
MMSGFDRYYQIVRALPRRRPACRPPAGIHPDRRGDLLHDRAAGA